MTVSRDESLPMRMLPTFAPELFVDVPQIVVEGPRIVRRRYVGRLLRFGVSPFLVGVDLLALAAAWTLLRGSVAGVGLLAVAGVTLNAFGRLYASRLSLSVLDDLPGIVARGLLAGAVALTVQTLVAPRHAHTRLLDVALAYVGFAVVGRGSAYSVVRSVRGRRRIQHAALILGAGKVGGQLATTLLEHPEYGLAPVGFLDPDPLLHPADVPVPLLGGFERLGAVIREFEVSEVIIAFGAAPESTLIDVLRTCDRLRCEIFFVPRLFEMHSVAGSGVETVWGLPLVRMRRPAFRARSWRAKRVLDIVLSGAALVLAAPLLAAIAVAVRLDGGPDVLFCQERVGLDGHKFRVYKFRTLRPVDEQESATQWSIAGDVRLTPLGRLLRRTSLDELPQLWNVLCGDMSLVGPRPERPHFVAEFARLHPRYVHRHRVPAGLTGWAQVHGLRGDTSIGDRAKFDNFYVENWSLWLDIKILLRTMMSFVRGAA